MGDPVDAHDEMGRPAGQARLQRRQLPKASLAKSQAEQLIEQRLEAIGWLGRPIKRRRPQQAGLLQGSWRAIQAAGLGPERKGKQSPKVEGGNAGNNLSHSQYLWNERVDRAIVGHSAKSSGADFAAWIRAAEASRAESKLENGEK